MAFVVCRETGLVHEDVGNRKNSETRELLLKALRQLSSGVRIDLEWELECPELAEMGRWMDLCSRSLHLGRLH